MRISLLRYFNACGADPEAGLSERHDPETHLIPLAIDAASGGGPPLQIFGTDYPTAEGTCERDFIHVSDLARGHLEALRYIIDAAGALMLNLGTGRSYSILQIISTIERVTGRPVPIITAFGRPGDPATSLPAERAAAIEYGLTQFQNTLAERDRLAEDLRRAEDRNHLVRAEVEMRDRAIMDLQRRIGGT